MDFKAELIVADSITTQVNKNLPDKVVAEIKKGMKLLPKMLKVKANDKLLKVACNVTYGTEVVAILNSETSNQNASKLQDFFGKMISKISKAHKD
jgi:hypothetical protein